MSAAIDTHAFVKRITAAGMPEAQAEVLADVLAERPPAVTKGAVIEAVEKLGRGIDRRVQTLESAVSSMRSEIDGRFERMETMLAKILEGQAVLHQNDMELKRRLDATKP